MHSSLRKRMALGVALAFVVGGAAACGGGGTTEGAGATEDTTEASPATTAAPEGPSGTLRVGASIGLITFDPHISQGATQSIYLEPVFEPLIARDDEGELVPGLATSWAYSDDAALVLEMDLRPDVTFHDGVAFDADVAVANLERARAADGPRNGELRMVSAVTAVDADSIHLELDSPSPTLVFALSSPLGMMMSPASMTAGDAATRPVGTGPWVYDADRSAPGQRHTFTAAPEHWDPESVGVEEIEILEMTDDDARLNALKTGQIDVGRVVASQAADAEGAGMSILSQPVSWWGFILQDRDGAKVPELGDVRVRQAMNFAVDREAIVDAVEFGLGDPTPQYRPAGSLGHSEKAEAAYPFDPDRAKELLADAGVDGFSFTVPILPTMATWAQAVQAYLADVGIDMELHVVEPGTLGAEGRSGSWGATAIIVGGAHPATDASIYVLEDSPFNPFKTKHVRAAELIEQAASEPDPDAQAAAYEEVSELLTEEAWFLITDYGVATTAVASHVGGLELVLGEAYWSYRNVRVE